MSTIMKETVCEKHSTISTIKKAMQEDWERNAFEEIKHFQ